MRTPLWYDERTELTNKYGVAQVEGSSLSAAERDRRWMAIRRKMFLRKMKCLVMYGNDTFWGMGMANVRYLTQLTSMMSTVVIFPLDGEPVAFNGPPHMHLPTHLGRPRNAWVEDVRPNEGVGQIVRELESRGLDKGSIGITGFGTHHSASNLPWHWVNDLVAALPQATITDETALLNESRMVKSAEEIELLRQAGRIAKRRVERMVAESRPGTTERELWAAMEHEQVIAGGEPVTFNLLASGPVTSSPEDGGLQHLLHGIENPASPTSRVLAEGDLIVCEFHTQYQGYLAATEFSVFIGEPPAPLQAIHDTAVLSQQAALDTIAPGVTLREAWRAMRAPVEAVGMDYVELGFHGHGMASPEYPSGIVYREEDQHVHGSDPLGEHTFEAGMVLGINIDIHDPAWRKDIGIMLGDMVVVTDDGCEPLIGIPTDVFGVAGN